MKTIINYLSERATFVVTLLAMVVSGLSLSAEDFVVDGLAYLIHADGKTVGVTEWVVNGKKYPDLREANIPENVTYEGATYTVTAIEEFAFSTSWSSHESLPLTKVAIPYTVTTIGNDAFYKCQNLKTVTFGDNVESIGAYAFGECRLLESIELPVKLTNIGRRTFEGCSSLKSVTIGKNVESIGVDVFDYCNNLKNIYCQLMNPVATTISSDTFNRSLKSSCTLHVPIGTKELYESCEYWSSFANIVEDLEADYESHAWIHLDATSLSTYPSRTHQLAAYCNPYNLDLSWSSSDESVATVDRNGVVKSIATGDVVITVTGSGDDHVTAMCRVTVKNASNMNDDTNGDGQVDIGDVNMVINMMLGKGDLNPDASPMGDRSCDVTGDGRIDISDVNQIINAMLGKPKPLLRCPVNDIMLNMTHVDGGTFTMGNNPSHQVTLSDYYIGQTEVTEELWMAVMGDTPPYYYSHSNNPEPISFVDWNLCQTFIAKLNELTGLNFRLPTEAEWEFAARGGNKSEGYIYSGSNNINEVAWYTKGGGVDDNPPISPQPIAGKKANELGIYDMSGNVSEWCQDWYGSYSNYEETNPTGPDSGEYRTIRGGCFFNYPTYCEITTRDGKLPSHSDEGSGFRLVMTKISNTSIIIR